MAGIPRAILFDAGNTAFNYEAIAAHLAERGHRVTAAAVEDAELRARVRLVYVGDLYSVDVVGARAAGMEGILLDPLGYWGPRDCATAPTVADVVALLLAR
jgi:FMN phosphatase YigB (HAD superfamily)